MDDVTGTVDRGAGVGTDNESAVRIDAIGDALHAALLTQSDANRATERLAALGIGSSQRAVVPRLRLPPAVQELERREHSGDHRRTRGKRGAELPRRNRK